MLAIISVEKLASVFEEAHVGWIMEILAAEIGLWALIGLDGGKMLEGGKRWPDHGKAKQIPFIEGGDSHMR